MLSRRTTHLAGALALATAAFAFQPMAANAADSFYKGKTLRIIVGAGVGGGYDAYGRMLAPHYARVLGATVVVENVLGGGGLRALNKLAAEPGDGMSISVANGAAASLTQLLDMPGAKYDLTKFEFLGIADYSRWNILVSPKSPYNSLADLMKAGKTISWGASGKISGLSTVRRSPATRSASSAGSSRATRAAAPPPSPSPSPRERWKGSTSPKRRPTTT